MTTRGTLGGTFGEVGSDEMNRKHEQKCINWLVLSNICLFSSLLGKISNLTIFFHLGSSSIRLRFLSFNESFNSKLTFTAEVASCRQKSGGLQPIPVRIHGTKRFIYLHESHKNQRNKCIGYKYTIVPMDP